MKGKFEELQGHFRLEREMTAILTTKIERITETFYMGELHILDASEIFNPEDRTDYTAAYEWRGRKLLAVDRWRHDGILVQRSRTLIPFRP